MAARLSRPRTAALLAALLACLPLAVVLTLATAPLWGWVEARTGIEALGHSGPAEWCYGLVLALAWLATLALCLRRKPRA